MSTAPATPEQTAATGQPLMTQRQIMLVIVGLMAGMFLSSLDQTIVSTAIRTIGDDLHGLEQQAWVTTAYMITSTITTPIYGKLSDLFGRRPLYLFGIVVFILGSLLSSFSTSMIMLAAFRAFQGIGAGALMSLPMAIMGDMLAPRERAKYQGYFLAVFGISSVLGPLTGGLFAGADQILWVTGWRWVFLINVPIGLIALGMVWKFLHLPRITDATLKPRVDWWGATSVVVALVPLLLVAEQGREWGWTSPSSLTCFALSALGLAAFLIIESKMGQDAIIPLALFRSGAFSMSSILGFLVGFGMFGAMMTIPLYLQIVTGLTPTESGFATLPMMAGIMTASIVSGRLVASTGKYRIFPILGTALMVVAYYYLTFMTADRPLWFLMIGMFIMGLGLGQLMQSLTLAAQNAVSPAYMGVASSASTFFRQIGGTMGTAVLLSVLFSAMPGNIMKAMGDEDDLRAGLDAALTPVVASDPANQGIMEQMWNQVVSPAQASIATQLTAASDQARATADEAVYQQVSAAVQAQVDAGTLPADQTQTLIDTQVAEATPAAEEAALATAAEQAHASVVDGVLTVDWSDQAQRSYWVNQLAPSIAEQLASTSTEGASSGVSTSDTSYLIGADARLTRPFMVGFNASTLSVYWVGFLVTVLAFVLALFFKTPPLRTASGLQENAQKAGQAQGADEQVAGSGAETPASRDVLEAQSASTGALPVSGVATAGGESNRQLESESTEGVSDSAPKPQSEDVEAGGLRSSAPVPQMAAGASRPGLRLAGLAGLAAAGAALVAWARRRSR
ncbi:MDR family MFS transporter [Rothia nasimurium]|uniref:MDR family MFS transporter n=1 Tax=Rothia nasimurium TaxID=85336 RepID=UPI001F447C24|nr:MDR family MFS transporter [Rothia nasimurium]